MPYRAQRVVPQIVLGADLEGGGTPFYHAQQLGSTTTDGRSTEKALPIKHSSVGFGNTFGGLLRCEQQKN
jgi:hypothetical protein